MKKIPLSELNSSPSVATFDPVNPDSVRSRLTEKEMSNLPTNGHSLESLRQFSPLNRMDKIDQIGVATHMLAESAATYKKSGLYSSLIKKSQKTKN